MVRLVAPKVLNVGGSLKPASKSTGNATKKKSAPVGPAKAKNGNKPPPKGADNKGSGKGNNDKPAGDNKDKKTDGKSKDPKKESNSKDQNSNSTTSNTDDSTKSTETTKNEKPPPKPNDPDKKPQALSQKESTVTDSSAASNSADSNQSSSQTESAASDSNSSASAGNENSSKAKVQVNFCPTCGHPLKPSDSSAKNMVKKSSDESENDGQDSIKSSERRFHRDGHGIGSLKRILRSERLSLGRKLDEYKRVRVNMQNAWDHVKDIKRAIDEFNKIVPSNLINQRSERASRAKNSKSRRRERVSQV